MRRPASQTLIGVILVIISAFGYSLIPIFAHLAYADGATPLTVLLVRFGLAAVVILAALAVRRVPFPRGSALGRLVLLGLFGYVGQGITYFVALTVAPASVLVLIFYLAPAAVMVASHFFYGEPVTPVKLAALALAILGAVLTIDPATISLKEGLSGEALGILLAFLNVGFYTFYVLASRRMVRSVTPFTTTAVIIPTAALAYVVIAGFEGYHFPAQAGGWAALLGMAVFSTVIAMAAFLAGLQRIGPTSASTVAVVEPATVIVLAALFLGERLAPIQLLGGALILAAVILIARS